MKEKMEIIEYHQTMEKGKKNVFYVLKGTH